MFYVYIVTNRRAGCWYRPVGPTNPSLCAALGALAPNESVWLVPGTLSADD